MFLRLGRLELFLHRNSPWTRDVSPRVSLGGDPVGKTLWMWWLGYEMIATLLPPRPVEDRKENTLWLSREPGD